MSRALPTPFAGLLVDRLRRSRWTIVAAFLMALAGPTSEAQAQLVQLKPEQLKGLGLRTQAVWPAGDVGRVTLQGQVSLPPHLLRVVSAPVAGVVEQVHVSRGDAVKAQQALVSLNAPQLVEWQREYQQAALQSSLAQQTARRDEALLAEGIIAAARAQTSQSQWQMAQAALREKAQLLQMAGVKPDGKLSGHVALSAPGRGSVVELLVQTGQRVEAGAPLLKFASQGPLSIDLQASAAVARRLKIGDQVRVDGCELPARLVSINTALDAGSQTVALRAQWPRLTDCALPQQRVQVEVALSQPAGAQPGAWLVPDTAVLKQGTQDLVFVQRPQGFMAVPVKVMGQQAAPEGAPAGSAVWRQVVALQVQQLLQNDAVVVQGAVALKGVMQGLGAQ